MSTETTTDTGLNREQWLNAAVSHLRHWYQVHGHPIPEKIRVSCGWPSKGATSSKNRRAGECWDASASGDSHNEIFISPTESDATQVFKTLCHELVHAAVGCKHGHKAPFKRACKDLGLEGKPTSAEPGERLMPELKTIVATSGEYPHATLTPGTDKKKQSTRLIKVECETCGYTARVTRKWIESTGTPLCPCNSEPMTNPTV